LSFEKTKVGNNQYNPLSVSLDKNIFIPKETYHRVIKGCGKLIVKNKEIYMNEKVKNTLQKVLDAKKQNRKGCSKRKVGIITKTISI